MVVSKHFTTAQVTRDPRTKIWKLFGNVLRSSTRQSSRLFRQVQHATTRKCWHLAAGLFRHANAGVEGESFNNVTRRRAVAAHRARSMTAFAVCHMFVCAEPSGLTLAVLTHLARFALSQLAPLSPLIVLYLVGHQCLCCPLRDSATSRSDHLQQVCWYELPRLAICALPGQSATALVCDPGWLINPP
jgi:hypothetical protein